MAHQGDTTRITIIEKDLVIRQEHKLDHDPSRNQAQDIRLDQSNAPFHADNAGSALHAAGTKGHHGSAASSLRDDQEPRRDVLEYIGEPHFAKNEKSNQALIGEPFVTGSSPAGGEHIHARGPNYQVTAENMDARIPRAEGYIGEPTSGVHEKQYQSLIGGIPFATGTSTDGRPEKQHSKIGDPQITSGNLKDNEDGTTPVVLGGHYDRTFVKPVGEQDFDAEHGHKTDMPWGSREGSGFDKDWQYENNTGAESQRQNARIGDPEITSGSLKDNEDGTIPVVLGGHYDRDFVKPSGEQDFDAVHGHKTDIPWRSGEGSGFDKDWKYENQEK